MSCLFLVTDRELVVTDRELFVTDRELFVTDRGLVGSVEHRQWQIWQILFQPHPHS